MSDCAGGLPQVGTGELLPACSLDVTRTSQRRERVRAYIGRSLGKVSLMIHPAAILCFSQLVADGTSFGTLKAYSLRTRNM